MEASVLCMDCMLVPPNLYVEALTPNVTVLGWGSREAILLGDEVRRVGPLPG